MVDKILKAFWVCAMTFLCTSVLLVLIAQAQEESTARQIREEARVLLHEQQLGYITDRVKALESIQIDRRISVVENTLADLKTLMMGNAGGLVGIGIHQVLLARGRRRRREGEVDDDPGRAE